MKDLPAPLHAALSPDDDPSPSLASRALMQAPRDHAGAPSAVRADADKAMVARRLVKRYGATTALDRIDLEVSRGELLVVAGPNGAGKTTLLEVCEGLREADEGEVLLFDQSPRELESRRRMGVQLDEASFHRHIEVGEILSLYAQIYGKKQPSEQVVSSLALHTCLRKQYGGLSKGWKQRVSIAVALLHEPDIVFLDELSDGLDPEVKHVVWDLVLAQTKRKAAVVLTSHSMEEAERLADRVVIIVGGKIVQEGSPSRLRSAFPTHWKIEVPGDIDGSVPYALDSIRQAGSTTLFTNEPEPLLDWVNERWPNGRVFSGPITLEDLYLYYVKKAKACSPPFSESNS